MPGEQRSGESFGGSPEVPGGYGRPGPGGPGGLGGGPGGLGGGPGGPGGGPGGPGGPAAGPTFGRRSGGRRGMIIGGVVVVILVLLAVGAFSVVSSLNTRSTSNFAVGSCVRKSGNSAVKADCDQKGAFTVVSKVDNQSNCPDQDQPYVVVGHTGGKDQVLCLRPASNQ